ncbi:MAG: AMP-binding protein [Gammaproteobacteria bacterium]|nr:AMP-binding protein [Gammaproteobacteria bacterium]
MNLALQLQRSGLAARNAPAVAVGTQVQFTYGQLADRAARIAGGLRGELGLVPGDRVALVMRNCAEYLELLYACWHAGLVAVPVNAKLHTSEFAYILGNSGASLCFTTPDLTAAVVDSAVLAESRVITIGTAAYASLLEARPIDVTAVSPQDAAWMFYTSGTTGKPKGAVLTHRNLLAMSWCYFADVDQQSPWRSMLHLAPMSHGSGLYALPHVMQASCHVIPESAAFEAAEAFALIRHWPASVFFAAPTMVKRLLDHPADTDTRQLKTIIYGGGPMYVDDSLAALDRFGPKLAQLYGQGESPMTITALSARMHAERDHSRWLERLASVGIAQSAVEVRIRSDGDWLAQGEVGEVVVRGDTVMQGYWQQAEESAETLRDGWLHTGDYGCLDAEGFLTLKDRAKDLIISGGNNIYPREVEEVLVSHADVAEVSVIGRPDREWGESVVAYVVAARGRHPDPAALDRYCLERIARYKRPRYYRFIEQLPKNNYGKVLKTRLRELDTAAESAAQQADTTEP